MTNQPFCSFQSAAYSKILLNTNNENTKMEKNSLEIEQPTSKELISHQTPT
jgi:hypothetical protein